MTVKKTCSLLCVRGSIFLHARNEDRRRRGVRLWEQLLVGMFVLNASVTAMRVGH